MYYEDTETGEFSISLYEAKKRANVSCPIGTVQIGQFWGYASSDIPNYDPITQYVTEVAPVDHVQQWRIDDLSPEQIADNLNAAVPQVVSRAQFILALLQLDLLDDVEAAIDAADRATQINYRERLEFERSFPLVTTMAQALGKSDAEVDALFMLAATL